MAMDISEFVSANFRVNGPLGNGQKMNLLKVDLKKIWEQISGQILEYIGDEIS